MPENVGQEGEIVGRNFQSPQGRDRCWAGQLGHANFVRAKRLWRLRRKGVRRQEIDDARSPGVLA